MTAGSGGTGVETQPKFEQPDSLEIEALRQLREFFGSNIHDDIARKALRSAKTATGNYDIQYAVNWLLDQNLVSFNQQPGVIASPTTTFTGTSITAIQKLPPNTLNKDGIVSASKPRQPTVSGSEDTELQKAIALSLQDRAPQTTNQQPTPLGLGGQISAEEQELSKVIEASIAESKKGASHDLRQSSLFFIDPANPHERERQGSWPVGLKNIGNTCWFSVVIQALFHLPIFRRRLLNADFDTILRNRQSSETAATSSSPSVPILPRELEFAIELRKLFSLLLGSRRKYVDPSGAVDVLRKQDSLQLRNIGGLDSGQQDVSEFTHLLFEWLEEAFKAILPSSGGDVAKSQNKENDDTAGQSMEIDTTSSKDNAIEQLFYGTFVKETLPNPITVAMMSSGGSEGVHQTERDSNIVDLQASKEERFSQYPLQVVGCETLHDSVEKSLRPEESPDVEHWLKRLPPVFLFELSRFQYNQTDKKPEKIHSKFRFPKVLYVDRYLQENKIAIRQKRGEIGRLRQQLNALNYQLEKLENFYGSKMSLPGVLSLTLQFIGRGDDTKSTSCETEPMDECDTAGEDVRDNVIVQSLPIRPTDVSDEELEVMERCLNRWRSQFLQHAEELKSQIREVEEKIEEVYTEPRFQQHPYVLHSILVHEGQATLGHYWAFVGNRRTDKWLKFNDVQVTEVSFDEVERDSFGGYQNSSAYCLFYVDVHRSDLLEDLGSLNETQLVASLPPDLQCYVSEDNIKFTTELHEWDRKHTKTTITPVAQSSSPINASNLRAINETELAELVEDHTRLSSRYLLTSITNRLRLIGSDPKLSAEDLLNQLMEDSLLSIKQEGESFLSQLGWDGSSTPKWHACTDVRVQNWLPFYAYCWIQCGGGKQFGPYDQEKVMRRIVLDYYANVVLVSTPSTERFTEIYQAAKRMITSNGSLPPVELQIYARINYDYKLYLQTLVLISHALEQCQKDLYLPAFYAITLTEQYAKRLSNQSAGAGGVDMEFLLQCLRVILVHFSEQLVKELLSSNNSKEVIDKFKQSKQQVLHYLAVLCRCYKDTTTLEAVRALWFSAVTDEKNILSDTVLGELNDFLDTLAEVENLSDGRTSLMTNAKIKLQPDVVPRYFAALRVARDFGILQCHATVTERPS